MKYISSASLLGMALLITTQTFAEKGTVPYPADYRQWSHIKSMIIKPGHPLENPFQGLHHIYANNNALKGLDDGSFPNGSVLVFDLLNYESKTHAILEGDRKLIGVMVKDNKLYSKTGGWGFEGFEGDSITKRLVTDEGESCFSCHASQKNQDYVLSTVRR